MVLSNQSIEPWYLFVFIPNLLLQFKYFIEKFTDYIVPLSYKSLMPFTFLILLVTLSFNFTKETFTLEIINSTNKKLKKFKIFLIFLILYNLSILFLFQSIYLLLTGILLCLTIAFYIKGKFIDLAVKAKYSYRTDWQKYQSGVSKNSSNPNIFWQYKFFIGPLVKVSKSEKPHLFPYIFAWLFGFIVLLFSTIPVIIKFIVLSIAIAFLAENIFNLYFQFDGFCTDIIYSPDKGTDKYIIYLVDYKHKRKVQYTTYQLPYFNVGDYTKSTIGMFSRKVIFVSKSFESTH